MATKNLVYVHGAGKQIPADDLKKQLDQILFGGPLATSRVARLLDVRWPPIGSGMAVTGGGTGRARRMAAVKHAAVHTVSPDEAAEMIVKATLTAPRPARSARRHRVTARRRGPREGVLPARRPGRAPVFGRMRSGSGSSIHLPVGRRHLRERRVDYLFGPPKAAMQVPSSQGPDGGAEAGRRRRAQPRHDHHLRRAVRAGCSRTDDPTVLVTLGCPLGIDNVQDRLRDGAGRPNPIPAGITEWTNFADRFDPVAIEATLRDEFKPSNLIEDEAVNNQAKNNHDLNGYLTIGVVRSLIQQAVGAVRPQSNAARPARPLAIVSGCSTSSSATSPARPPSSSRARRRRRPTRSSASATSDTP